MFIKMADTPSLPPTTNCKPKSKCALKSYLNAIKKHVEFVTYVSSSYNDMNELVSVWFVTQDIVGSVGGLKVEGNARNSIVRRILVSLNFGFLKIACERMK